MSSPVYNKTVDSSHILVLNKNKLMALITVYGEKLYACTNMTNE